MCENLSQSTYFVEFFENGNISCFSVFSLLSILSIEHLFSMSFDFFYIFDGKNRKNRNFRPSVGSYVTLPPAPKSIDAKCIENFDGILSVLRGPQNRKYRKNRPQTGSWTFLFHPLLPWALHRPLGLAWVCRREVWLLDGVLRHVDIENIENIEGCRKKMFDGLNCLLCTKFHVLHVIDKHCS